MSQQEPDNPEDKCAICVRMENDIVGHLSFGRSGKFAKTRSNKLSSCKVIITGKFANLEDGDGMQLHCKVIFFWSEGMF